MRRTTKTIVLLLAAAAVSLPALSQELAERLTLASAKAIAAGCQGFAESNGLGVTVAVLDGGGDLKLLHRMENATFANVEIATMKARTPAGLGMSSQRMGEIAERLAGIAFVPGLASWQGGLPIYSKDGALLGGVGVSGATAAQDEACAAAGLEAAGLLGAPTQN